VADLTAERLDVDGLLANPATRIVVCCGAGGVGKTTTAAALGVRAAEVHGRRTVVLTIDPARRLAQSMGLSELDNTPRQVKGIDGENGGELHAMMLDMKRTFDEVVQQHTTPQRAAEIFANPFYQAMSSTFAGTQEYMAMEKLGQLRSTDEWDLIVVDTPPSRSALDFLDAPARLSRFLDGRMLRMLLAPARAGGKSMFSLVTASFGLFSRAVQKVLGAQLLTDLSGSGSGPTTRTASCKTRRPRFSWWRRPSGTPYGKRPILPKGCRPNACRSPVWSSIACTTRMPPGCPPSAARRPRRRWKRPVTSR
jgi:hypothetical protein